MSTSLEWTAVTVLYLHELYTTISTLKAEIVVLGLENERLVAAALLAAAA